MDKMTRVVVGGVVALVVIGLAAAAMVRGRETPPDLHTPSGVVLAYALSEQRGDPQTAWDLLATSAQARADRDHFLAFAATHASSDRVYATTEDERVDANGGASVVLVQTHVGSSGLFDGSSNSSRTTVRLTRQGGDWRIVIPPDDYLLITRSGQP